MHRQRKLFIAMYAASGAAGLVYEIAWTRLLTLNLGHTVAAASTVLAAFMGGLALGAWLAGRLLPGAPPRRDAIWCLRSYAGLEIAVALAAIALPSLLSAFTPALSAAYADGAAPIRFG